MKLGYPFVEAIRSALPLVDEFVVALGDSDDGTEERLRKLNEPKLRIINTQWNDGMSHVAGSKLRGFVYGQQRSVALFNCTGDWAIYIDADELLHEDDLPKIYQAMKTHLDDKAVEALVFDFVHFYGNANTIAWSPRWYRSAARIVRNTVPYWTPKGMAFVMLQTQKSGRYPRAAHTGATIYHYGWVRSEEHMLLKQQAVNKFGRDKTSFSNYAEIDPRSLRAFTGSHPSTIRDWLPPADGLYQPDPNHKLTARERKHRAVMWLEERSGIQFNKTHYKLIR